MNHDEYMKRFVAKFGEPSVAPPVSSATISGYRGRLPDRLLHYWQEYGFCSFADGLFWLVDPAEYEEVVGDWLGQTHLANRENFHVIARTAFGKFYVQGDRSTAMTIVTPYHHQILPADLREKEKVSETRERAIGVFFAARNLEDFDCSDADDNLLFSRVLKRLGPVAADEVYAFVPALALGGSARSENVQKVKLQEHLAFLAQLDEVKVLKSVGELFGS